MAHILSAGVSIKLSSSYEMHAGQNSGIIERITNVPSAIELLYACDS